VNNQKVYFLGISLSIISFVGTACQPLDYVDKLPYHEQKWAFLQDELNTLSIESEYEVDMEFIASPDGTNYVEVSGNMQQNTVDQLKETEITGNTLGLQLEKDVKLVAPNYKSIKTEIIVALADETQLQQITYKSKFSNSNFTGLTAENIDMSVSSGNSQVEDINAKRLSLTSKNGDIVMGNIQGNAEIQTHSGSIKLIGLIGALKVQSTAGNVIVTGQRSDSMDISVRSGDVALSPDRDFKGFFDLKTTTGHIIAPEPPQETNDVIKIRAVSGDIRIQ
jgi:lia operon protein LiaG